ncbi:MAG: 3-dehydroquinate dehydratase [Erysipelotrichales bacterium]|nr:3-dehydroquinate dehydratase [Erysipelotrichales bacterium]
MRLLIINGVNINMLGIREKAIYGNKSYEDLCNYIRDVASKEKVKLNIFCSNYEGEIVEKIQDALGEYDGIIINPGAYAHYSIAILDALRSVNLPSIEVHLTDVTKREKYRQVLLTSDACFLTIMGKGFSGYKEAILEMKKKLGE